MSSKSKTKQPNLFDDNEQTLIVLFMNNLEKSPFLTIPNISLADSWAETKTALFMHLWSLWKKKRIFHIISKYTHIL